MAISFVVEDGTGKSDATSFATVAQADQFHENRGNTGWTGTDAVKQAALISATQYVETNWSWATGRKASKEQALGWPRFYAYDDEGYAIDTDEIPQAVIDAVCQAALDALTEDLQPNQDRAVSEERVEGAVHVKYEPGTSQTTRRTSVEGLLGGLVYSGVVGEVVRA